MKPLATTLTTLLGFLGLSTSRAQPKQAPAAPVAERKLGMDAGGTEAQWQALQAFTPRLPEMLERVRVKAEYLGFKGWPEFPTDQNADRGGRQELQNPLLNRVWSHPKVLWHADADGRTLDALVGMELIADSGKEEWQRRLRLVFVEDVFGICKLRPTGVTLSSYFAVCRAAPDDDVNPLFPTFIKRGEVWAFYQENDGSLETVVTLYHPRMGTALLLDFVETPEGHRQGLQEDEMTRKKLIESRETDYQVEDSMAQEGHRCSGFTTADLPTDAPLAGGLRWFKVGQTHYASTDELWKRWHGHAARPLHMKSARKTETP